MINEIVTVLKMLKTDEDCFIFIATNGSVELVRQDVFGLIMRSSQYLPT